jgi:hypothetical protein
MGFFVLRAVDFLLLVIEFEAKCYLGASLMTSASSSSSVVGLDDGVLGDEEGEMEGCLWEVSNQISIQQWKKQERSNRNEEGKRILNGVTT